MPFTVRDFQGLVRALERRAEWKAELRRLLLTDELLSLPGIVRDLAAEVRELAQSHRALAESHAQLAAEVRELAQSHRALAQSHAQLAADVRELAQSHRALAQSHAQLAADVRDLAQSHRDLAAEVRELAQSHAHLAAEVRALAQSHRALAESHRALAQSHAELAAEVRQLTTEVRALTAAQRAAEARLGRLEGSDLERRYRERAAGFFQRLLSRIRLVDHQELALLLDDARDAGRLTADEKEEILLADVVVRGRREQRETYVLAEVSAVVDAEDVRRAASRARLLERVVGAPVLAAAAGQRATPEAVEGADAAGVWLVLDGRADAPLHDRG
jgi:chromosome segregation ATPase